MKTKDLIKYREFDRKANPRPSVLGLVKSSYSELTEEIKINGITEPLELWVYRDRALLVEGNHRLAIAIDLGIEDLPVTIKHITGANIVEKEYIKRILIKDNNFVTF